MKNMTVVSVASATVGAACLVCAPAMNAATTQTLGSGSAVSAADRVATFDSLTSTNITELNNYVEAGLRISTGSQNWGADPPYMIAALHPFGGVGEPNLAFFGMANGTAEWITIENVNQATMYAVEFMYGNTWSLNGMSWGNDQGFVEWQTLKNGTVVSAGQAGPNPILPLATVIGFFDPAGFDQLQVKCRMANSFPTNFQALALDNLAVQLTNRPPAPVIYGGDFSINPATGVTSLTVWDTRAGVNYRLVYSENLASGVWTPVTPPLPSGWVSGGGPITFPDANASGKPRRFCRVEAQ